MATKPRKPVARETAKYIHEHLRALAQQARDADLETLGQLIELAALEAASEEMT